MSFDFQASKKIPGVLVGHVPFRFKDHRGEIVELFNARTLLEDKAWQDDPGAFFVTDFVKHNLSISRQNVLRGIHGDRITAKLATCIFGRIWLVGLDRRPGKNKGTWEGWELNAKNRIMVFLPAGVGMGHLILSRKAILYYAWTAEYDSGLKDGGQFTVRWNDPRYYIQWPLCGKRPILSERDGG